MQFIEEQHPADSPKVRQAIDKLLALCPLPEISEAMSDVVMATIDPDYRLSGQAISVLHQMQSLVYALLHVEYRAMRDHLNEARRHRPLPEADAR